jgi:hypothetical protein
VVGGCLQGDQMSLSRNQPKCSLIHILSNLVHTLYEEKCGPKIRENSAIFKKLTKENDRQEGKNSPYLVTLVAHLLS